MEVKQENSKSTDMLYYESRRGENWTHQEVKILTEWIHISATFLDILSEASESYRKTLRANTIINLVFSTVASTLSVSTFNMTESTSPNAALAIKIAFTCMTMILTIAAGYIKVYQIQEKLENSLRLKNEWALFGSKISSEMQLPLMLRTNGIALVNKMKDTYLQLVQSDMGIRKDIIKRMAARSGLTTDDLTLSEIFERIANDELSRIMNHDETVIELTDTEEKPVNDIIVAAPITQAMTVMRTNETATNPMATVLKDIMNIGKSSSVRAPIRERGRIASFIQKPASSTSSKRPTVRRTSVTSSDSIHSNVDNQEVVPSEPDTLEPLEEEASEREEEKKEEHEHVPASTHQPASWNLLKYIL